MYIALYKQVVTCFNILHIYKDFCATGMAEEIIQTTRRTYASLIGHTGFIYGPGINDTERIGFSTGGLAATNHLATQIKSANGYGPHVDIHGNIIMVFLPWFMGFSPCDHYGLRGEDHAHLIYRGPMKLAFPP